MGLFRFAPAPLRKPPPNALIRIFQSEVGELREDPEPAQLRFTLYALVGLFVTLLAVSVFMQMNRVVTSIAGQIVTTEPTIVLQALDPSIIKSLNTQEGERVKGGQILATLDPTFAAADVDAATLQIASLDAQIARAEAELANRDFNPPLETTPEAAYMVLQRAYYLQRKGQFEAQLHAYDEQIAQNKATIRKLKDDFAHYDDRVKISQEIENMRASLAASQVGSRLNLLSATDQRLEVLRNLDFDRNGLAESEHQLASTIANRDAFVEQWNGQVSQELVTARNTLDATRQQLTKAAKHKDLVRLEAPEDAVVLKLAKLSVGSVLKEADPFISLAPLTSPVEAEVHISARDIGFVRPGDGATVKLDPFNFVEHGTASGYVRWISEGAFSQDDNGNAVDPYYKARIALTEVKLNAVPDSFRLVPGMTLTADINVGSRSVFMYVLKGVIRSVNEAMREP
ncbi:MAG TPA: HlyD family type I secretion periplasmic adaptor subunit [Stellaceae bacterium]|nr:HlyD family type I secretion periplasmic adaptor subunit [Stellaceae bacterium]